jgi:hypothetical protein
MRLHTFSRAGALSLAGTLAILVFTSELGVAQTYTVLYSFASGSNPSGLGIAGDDYVGTTLSGGLGGGTLFSYSNSNGEFSALANFGGSVGYGPLFNPLSAVGYPYFGVSQSGGENGWGSVWEYDPSSFGPVYSFCSKANCTDGATPSSNLVTTDLSTKIYGTTSGGGQVAAPSALGRCMCCPSRIRQ